jgi:translocation and assembly module TamA
VTVKLIALSLGLFLTGVAGAKAQDVQLEVTGGNDDLRRAIEAASLLLTLDPETAPSTQDYVAAARADYRRLLTGLYAEGYYGGAVSIRIDGREAADVAPLAAPDAIGTVTIAVAAGPRFTFGQAVIAPLVPGTELPDAFATGEVARSGAIREAARAGVDAWREVGHAKAETTDQQIVAEHPQERLDVAVAIAPGPRLTFGDLTISGNVRVGTERIRQITGLPRGRVFSPEEVDRATARLRRTGAFASVSLTEADTFTADGSLPFALAVIEQPPRRLGFGIELSSLDGLTLTSFWLHRNLLGGAERLRIEGTISDISGSSGGTDYRIAAAFNRPATFTPDTDLSVTAEIERQDEPGYLLDQATFAVGVTRYMRNGVTVSGAVGLRTAREVTPFATREYTLLTLPLTGELDRRDVPLDPSSGFYLNLEATPFLGLAGGADGGRFYADGRIYRSFGENDRVTLAARGQFGSVLGAGIFEAPADFLFYSGGGGSVRGQPYQSLGIQLSRIVPGTGAVSANIGGLSFVGGQFEARVGVTERIGIVGFYDIGFVGEESLPSDQGDWHAGAGIGLRYGTPIGPLRLDLATPASGDDAFDSVQLYLGIGQAF